MSATDKVEWAVGYTLSHLTASDILDAGSLVLSLGELQGDSEHPPIAVVDLRQLIIDELADEIGFVRERNPYERLAEIARLRQSLNSALDEADQIWLRYLPPDERDASHASKAETSQ
jgi:hypothetical protein